MTNVVKAMAQDLQRIPEVDRLPKSVEDVCDIIGNQFEDTANMLEERAEALIGRAQELKDMAKHLREASVNVPVNLKKWVGVEIEYRDAGFKVSSVNPDPNYR
jgi:predicted nuclease with TOPRIM domain